MVRFTDKVVLVTGSASGIGEATARRFGREGAKIVLADQDEGKLHAVAADIEAADVLTHMADLSKADACRSLIEAVIQRFGRLDVLVNNATRTSSGTWTRATSRISRP